MATFKKPALMRMIVIASILPLDLGFSQGTFPQNNDVRGGQQPAPMAPSSGTPVPSDQEPADNESINNAAAGQMFAATPGIPEAGGTSDSVTANAAGLGEQSPDNSISGGGDTSIPSSGGGHTEDPTGSAGSHSTGGQLTGGQLAGGQITGGQLTGGQPSGGRPARDDMIDADGDGHPANTDCNDGDSDRHPGAQEICDGQDQDCDSLVDEGIPTDGQGCQDLGPPPFPTWSAACKSLVARRTKQQMGPMTPSKHVWQLTYVTA